jgi:hypothetical protein
MALYQTHILNSLIHFDKYFIKKTQKDLVHPLCVSGSPENIGIV